MEKKTFDFEIKELNEEGKFSGYLSTFGNVDAGGDIVDPGAFKKTLRENKAFALTWAHQGMVDTIVGSFVGQEDEKGLFINGSFFLNLDAGLKAYNTAKTLISKGVKVGLSIGYRAIKWLYDTIESITVRRLKELKLKEGAVTLWPMNEQAQIEMIKEEGEADLETKPSKENHVCTIGSGDYVRYRSAPKEHEGKPYTIRYGIKKDGKSEEYEYFYPVKSWTAAAAKAHCTAHKGSFEAATSKAINFVCKSCGETLTLTEPVDATLPGAEPPKPEPSELHSVLQKIADELKK